jgi:adenylate kinase family enzyme
MEVKRIMSEGGLIPNNVTLLLLVEEMIRNPAKNYLIDGFPRTVA